MSTTVMDREGGMMGCETCRGSGKLRYRIAPTPGSVDLGDGMTMVDVGGTGTQACVCVRDLPATDGKATWWETELLLSETVALPIGDECAEIMVDGEVPRDENGHRVHRVAENAYYPTLVRVEIQPPAVELFGDDARELAAALIRAADACDKADAGLWKISIEEGKA